MAHGALIIGDTSAASTKILEDFDRPMVSVGYERIRFLKPVYFGDTLTIDYVIESIERDLAIHHTVDPGGIGKHDGQENDYRHQHDEQGQPA